MHQFGPHAVSWHHGHRKGALHLHVLGLRPEPSETVRGQKQEPGRGEGGGAGEGAGEGEARAGRALTWLRETECETADVLRPLQAPGCGAATSACEETQPVGEAARTLARNTAAIRAKPRRPRPPARPAGPAWRLTRVSQRTLLRAAMFIAGSREGSDAKAEQLGTLTSGQPGTPEGASHRLPALVRLPLPFSAAYPAPGGPRDTHPLSLLLFSPQPLCLIYVKTST